LLQLLLSLPSFPSLQLLVRTTVKLSATLWPALQNGYII
jgi:hypothetical protein